MRRSLLLPLLAGVLGLAAAFVIASSTYARGASARDARGNGSAREQRAVQRASVARAAPAAVLLAAIVRARNATWRWERVVSGRARSRYAATATRTPSLGYRRWVLRVWRRRATRARRLALHPPRLAAWLCIHRHEGAWTDPGAPYYGGLQMNLEFQEAFAPDLLREKGTADHWTPLEQIWAAERAYRSGLGFEPWPTTARMCGLL